jgi:hypothetical protein
MHGTLAIKLKGCNNFDVNDFKEFDVPIAFAWYYGSREHNYYSKCKSLYK